MNDTYDASHITVLEGLTPVRERPAMYIGSTDTRGLHHIVYEVVDNSIDEALAGFCTLIAVVINSDGSITVDDNGRGIPVDRMEKNGKSALEVVLTVLHAGGKFDKATYQVSGGLHGVGVSVVNALSAWLAARVFRDGNIYDMRFAQGRPVAPISQREETLEELLLRYQLWYGSPAPFARSAPHSSRPGQQDVTTLPATPDEIERENRRRFLAEFGYRMTGTRITFLPDSTIFETTKFDYDTLAHRLRELAFLNSGVTIRITDDRSGDRVSYCYTGGLSEFVNYLNEGAECLHPEPIDVRGQPCHARPGRGVHLPRQLVHLRRDLVLEPHPAVIGGGEPLAFRLVCDLLVAAHPQVVETARVIQPVAGQGEVLGFGHGGRHLIAHCIELPHALQVRIQVVHCRGGKAGQ